MTNRETRWALCVAAGVLAGAGGSAWAAAGGPLPRCAVGSQSFYLARYTSTASYPTTTLEQITLNGASATVTPVWAAEGAPLPPPEDVAAAGRTAGATVAMGMHPSNGYIYAVRAVENDPGWPGYPATWRDINSHYQIFKYGASGVDNLGPIQGLPSTLLYQLGPNYNAADFDPVSGDLYIANFQSSGQLNTLVRVSLAGDVPTYVSTLTLSPSIPGAQSGDFAIDASGTYAYGIAKASGGLGTSMSYRINLATGAVQSLLAPPGLDTYTPFGAAARLQDGNMAFYVAGTGGIRLLTVPTGAVSGSATTAAAASADAASCLPLLPQGEGEFAVPTLETWALGLLGGLLAAVAGWRRRRQPA
jgi:hypothetical protein